MHHANLFVLEGPDAVGKATQAQLLAQYLGAPAIAFPRYTASQTGAVVNDLLHERVMILRGTAHSSPKSDPKLRDALMLQHAMTFDRYTCDELWETTDERALVLDRYWMSGAVYGALDGLDKTMLLKAHRGLPTAKVAILLTLPIELQVERLLKRGRLPDRYEAQKERLVEIDQLYRGFWAAAPDAALPWLARTRWLVVDGQGTVEEVHARIIDAIAGR